MTDFESELRRLESERDEARRWAIGLFIALASVVWGGFIGAALVSMQRGCP